MTGDTAAAAADGAGPDSAARRVLIADDHVPTRARVRKVLERAGFVVCAEAASADGAVEAALRERPDVCLLDVHMPGNGIRAAGLITARLTDTMVVMLTVSREQQDACDSMRAGAAAYLLKDMDPARMSEALEAAMQDWRAGPVRFTLPCDE